MRGRKRGMRWISVVPPTPGYHPDLPGHDDLPHIDLYIEELEAMKLVDLDGLYQEEAALRMGISRRTLWNDLKSGRRKVVQAIINGWRIRIIGKGKYREVSEWTPGTGEGGDGE